MISTDNQVTKILLIEDNPGDARLIREMLAEAGGDSFALEWVSQLSEGLERLSVSKVDIVLLDLGLPDSWGLDTFLKAYSHAPDIPFVLITGLDDETLALTALRQGAQDYLVKGKADTDSLLRVIRYAIERKWAEKAIEAERKKLYVVLDSLPAFIHLKGADFKISFANRRFNETFGEPGDKPCYEILQRRSEPCEDCQVLEILKTRVPQKFERTLSLNGHTYEIYNYPFCVDDDLRVLTMGIDITERKRAEEQRSQLAFIVESSEDAIIGKTSDGIITSWNLGAKKIYGYSSEEVIGQPISILVPPNYSDEVPQILEKIARGEPVNHYETARLRKDGSLIHVSLTISPIKKMGGRLMGASTIARDITERKQAEEVLQESERNLRYFTSQLLTAQERERQRISRDLHDDLGQSLMSLKLGLRAIEQKLPKELSDIRQGFNSEIGFIDKIVENVRRISKELSPSILEDLGLTSALKRLFKEFGQRNGIELSLNIDNIEDLFSQEAQIIIYRIHQECLTNIGRHAQATKVDISIKKNQGRVDFKVQDNGTGFDLRTAMARDSSVKGLGLAAMEERVRMLGGSLDIWSRRGQGTKISFTLPIERN